MKLCRKLLCCFAVALLFGLLLSFTCAASEDSGNPIDLYVNDVRVDGARLINGVAYAPYRALISTLDPAATFTWYPELNASAADTLGIRIVAYVNQNYMDANGRILYTKDAASLNFDGTVYVPVRPISVAYSVACIWNGEDASVHLEGEVAPISSGEEYYDEDVLYWLSRIISAESRGEPLVGQIAVGNVVINRTEDGSFPDTVYGVIFDRKNGTQFTPVSTGSVYNDPTDSSVLAAKVAMEGIEVVDNALFFCAGVAREGSWMDTHREYIETIGNHSFYS